MATAVGAVVTVPRGTEVKAVEASTDRSMVEAIKAALHEIAEQTGGGLEVSVEHGVLKDETGAVTRHVALLLYTPPVKTL